VATDTSALKRGVALFESIQVWSVSPSQLAALEAVQGAPTGTDIDIWSSFGTTVASSARIVGSGGAVPRGPASLYLIGFMRPSGLSTLLM